MTFLELSDITKFAGLAYFVYWTFPHSDNEITNTEIDEHEHLNNPWNSHFSTEIWQNYNIFISTQRFSVFSNKTTQINWKYPLFIWQTRLNTNHHQQPITGGEGRLSRSIISLISDGIKLLFIYFVDKMWPRLIVGGRLWLNIFLTRNM